MFCSGAPLDWAQGFTSAHSIKLYLGCKSPTTLLSATHKAVATSTAKAGALCSLSFTAAQPLPVIPQVSYGQSHTKYPLALLFAGECVDEAGTALTLTYSTATLLQSITASVLPNHSTGQEATLTYSVVADGSVVSEGSVSSSSGQLTISIGRVVTKLVITLTSATGCVTGDWLPLTALPARTVDATKGGLLLDVSGNWFAVDVPVFVTGTTKLTNMQVGASWQL